jgi:hypothetical protein
MADPKNAKRKGRIHAGDQPVKPYDSSRGEGSGSSMKMQSMGQRITTPVQKGRTYKETPKTIESRDFRKKAYSIKKGLRATGTMGSTNMKRRKRVTDNRI